MKNLQRRSICLRMNIFSLIFSLHSLFFSFHPSKLLHLTSLIFLVLTKHSYSLELVSNLRNDTEVIETNVVLHKCSGANLTENYLEVEDEFIFGHRVSNNGSEIYVFKLKEGELECPQSNRTRFIIKLHKSGQNNSYYNLDTNNGTTETTKSEYEEDEFTEESEKNLMTSNNETSQIPFLDGIHPDGHRFAISRDGTLSIQFGDLKHSYHEAGDYCIQKISEIEVILSICNEDYICKRRPCIKKCCPLHQVMNTENLENPTCQNSGPLIWKPSLYENANSSDPLPEFEIKNRRIKPHLYYYNSSSISNHDDRTCNHFYTFLHKNVSNYFPPPYSQFSNFKILSNGSLFDDSEGLEPLPPNTFCVDGIQNFGKGEAYSGEHNTDMIYLEPAGCPEDYDDLPPEDIEIDEIHQTEDIVFYWIIVPFASLFLILTIIIYILVWDLHNIHGRVLFSYVCSLLGFYVCLFLSKIFSHDPLETTSKACDLNGAGIHFFFLAAACWLTVISFDIWWTFRKLKAGGASQNLRKFIAYSGFAVGIPVTIVFISYMLNLKYKDDENAPIIIPNYGAGGACALSNEAIGYYLYTPVGILLLCNVGFFTGTILTLLKYQRSITSALNRSSTNKEDQSYGKISDLKIKRFTRYKITAGCRQLSFSELKSTVGLRVFVKIFVVTGSTWILEIVGWGIKTKVKGNMVVDLIVIIFDTFNILLAVAIFFIFVWRPNIYNRLWEKYPCLRRILSLCILGTCCQTPPNEKHRPSFSAMTMSTIGRNGTLTGRKVSVDSAMNMVGDKQRKFSASSRTSSIQSNSRNSNPSDSVIDLVGDKQRKLSASSRTSSILSNPRNSNPPCMSTLMEDTEDICDDVEGQEVISVRPKIDA